MKHLLIILCAASIGYSCSTDKQQEAEETLEMPLEEADTITSRLYPWNDLEILTTNTEPATLDRTVS